MPIKSDCSSSHHELTAVSCLLFHGSATRICPYCLKCLASLRGRIGSGTRRWWLCISLSSRAATATPRVGRLLSERCRTSLQERRGYVLTPATLIHSVGWCLIKLVRSFLLSQWASVLSGVVLEQERMLPILLDLLDTNSEMELRPLTGLLRNLARHSSNKDHMGRWGLRTTQVGPNLKVPD